VMARAFPCFTALLIASCAMDHSHPNTGTRFHMKSRSGTGSADSV
jgi:hypothetical protein